MIKITTHKGIGIQYNSDTEIFSTVENDDFNANAPTLKGLKLKIDNGTRVKFERIEVIFSGWTSYEEGVLTSFDERTGEGWVSYTSKGRHAKKKERRKIYGHSIYLKTSENIRLFQEIGKLADEIGALQKRKTETESKLTPYVIRKSA